MQTGFERLEPYAGKLARTVLRGVWLSNGSCLPDQVQHQMAVTGKSVVDVCVLICGQEIRIYRIERDDELIDRLIELERRFWHYVEQDIQPPVDGTDSARQALRALYPHDSGNFIDLTDDLGLSTAFVGMVSLRAEIESKQEIAEHLKQQIQQRMGEASKATFRSGSVTWKRNKSGHRRFVVNVDQSNPSSVQQPISQSISQEVSGEHHD
ncbi:MAG: hypothetical protein KGO49_14775 [Gammaproteobacteria bacterium]|nr:hypothetical protein [Gammaproteobacteria bacterium]